MTTYLSPDAGARIVRLMIAGMVFFLLLVGYVFAQSYIGRHNLANSEKNARIELVRAQNKARSDLVDSQREGCERAKKDRQEGSVVAFTAILEAFRETDKQIDGPRTDIRAEAEKKIANAITSFQERASIDCAEAFPKVGT